MCLKDIKKNREYVIININIEGSFKRRLYDLGIIEDAKIKLLYDSPSKNIKAYLVKDTMIAIRNKIASVIEVGDLNN